MKKKVWNNLLIGGLLIVIGCVYLLFNLGILPEIWRSVILSWQLLLILLGAVGMFRKHYISGLFFVFIGFIFLFPKLSSVLGLSCSGAMLHSLIWPSIIIMIGLIIIFSRHKHHDHCYYHNKLKTIYSKEGRVDYNLMMNGIDEVFLGTEFRGGEINTFMGGVKLDLRRTSLPEGDSKLIISSVFGGVTLLIPEDWNVEIVEDSILGSFVDRRSDSGTSVQTDRRLLIEAKFLFGGGSIE